MEMIREQYRVRGYQEVCAPNIFNLNLWKTSGHYTAYKENMFGWKIEGQGFGMKPMNCPGHCLMFAHEIRSYRDLPLRFAEFGVLHRNEISGALSGLTRVRRFV
jgi:threonyl-tRNA synthetase